MTSHVEIFEVIHPGFGASVQDRGRVGWRRFGVPGSGVMDDHAAAWANRLLDNSADAPVIELALQGAELYVRRDAWIAISGANTDSTHPMWRAVRVPSGETIRFPRHHYGMWTYVAVEAGFDAPRLLGSASVYARGGLGRLLERGDVLRRAAGHDFHLPEHVAGRTAPWNEQRDYRTPPPLRVWPGPQWNFFSESEREKFFAQTWTVTSQSDRIGYRLTGGPLNPPREQIISEPVRVGTIQIPESGQPIVTLRDGPTVGGYPKLGLIEAADLSWLVQCCPGQTVRFQSRE
jgi:biotin-dependent carboxylase-like uncharacterized protein